MRHSLLGVWGSLLCAAACSSTPPPPPPPPAPPQVFITVIETNVIDRSITGTTNITGCKKVAQVQILTDNDKFLVDANFTGPNSRWEVLPATLNTLFSDKGFALPLNLYAKGICDDGRNNKSQAVSVTFFPVASVTAVAGAQALPDSFIAEGGIGSTPTSFVGCVGISTGVALARLDTAANVTAFTNQLPFNCTANSQISERSPVTSTRWLLEPGVGAFAFDPGLNITAVVRGNLKRMGVVRDGDALLWSAESFAEKLIRANPNAMPSERWSTTYPGIMNADPVADTGGGYVWGSSWQFDLSTRKGNIVALKYEYATGRLLQMPPDVLLTQNFAMFNDPVTPQGAFNIDGTLLYMPLLTSDANGNISSTVLACATNGPNCENATRRWIANGANFFPGIVSVALPFANGGLIAAAGPYQTWFLSSGDGTVKNFQGAAITPTGSMIVQGLQPGLGSDLYVLNGPNNGTGYPTEIVGIDAPDRGELWRVDYGAGDSPVGSMAIAIDEGGLPWLRVGPNQVKPLKNSEYRSVYPVTKPR